MAEGPQTPGPPSEGGGGLLTALRLLGQHAAGAAVGVGALAAEMKTATVAADGLAASASKAAAATSALSSSESTNADGSAWGSGGSQESSGKSGPGPSRQSLGNIAANIMRGVGR